MVSKLDQEKPILSDWKKQFQIIQGVVCGLLYLHHDSRLRIIHRDLKASNVLLDTNLNPKISDFGMVQKYLEGIKLKLKHIELSGHSKYRSLCVYTTTINLFHLYKLHEIVSSSIISSHIII
ncbi:putative protein kinase RLK-Pelle-DLSV family [Helianthus debilis subsp. tardiflorus]